MKKYLFILMLSLLFSAQTDYETWKKEQIQAQKDFISQQDKSFSNYLESHWQGYEMMQAIPMDTVPKPPKVPAIEKQAIMAVPQSKSIIDSIPIPKLQIEDKSRREIKQLPNLTTVSFWGLNLQFPLADFTKVELEQSERNEKFVADFWYKMSSVEYQTFLQQAQRIQAEIKLNDWGYVELIRSTGKEIHSVDESLINLFTWFFLVKSGFDAKVSFSENDIYLMISSQQNLYSIPFLTIADRRYYLFPHESAPQQLKLYTYDKKYPDADDVINMNITAIPEIPAASLSRNLLFSYHNQDYTIVLEYDKNFSLAKESYPQTDLAVYFGAPSSDALIRSVAAGFSDVLKGKPESIALDMLLRFVQTAFPYQTDDEQFGREKVMFPDEFLFYEFSDCEDRAIFFASLVKQILQLEVIGIDYPGHVATAVLLSEPISGDSIEFEGKQYLICDPTYINASIGMAMPQYKSVKPEIIVF